MNTFLVILLVAAMLATVVALVRGIISFLQEQSAQVRDEGEGPTAGQLKSNRMMQQRIMFQAAAILVCVLLLAAAGRT
ncbi:twin transmembrane helix small protein [uncultured Sphingomonas sp.]|uniref:twin transmembrane helix small protein n=1 Tax=uncultured Sphingomonas sp. TaxID=158754 RepID=UPI00260F8C26|nr:twin transmembrane helix small protein [uncultured Sphingomonas sp.]